MPELPEVETIRAHLAPHVEGRVLERVDISDPRWTAPDPPGEIAARLAGRRIEELARQGKYLLWRLDGGATLVQHLRMTGTVLFDPEVEPVHTRVRIGLGDGHRLAVVDPRRFGTGHLVDDEGAYLSARLGLEPLHDDFSVDHLRALARASRAPVKAFVLDQRRMAGVGNIYADEALFRAGIHPERPVNTLTRAQVTVLRDALAEVLREGISARGASIDDFRDPAGVQGSFQDAFRIHLRAGQPCVRCGGEVEKIVVGGRGTYVCRTCQPRPRRRRVRPRS